MSTLLTRARVRFAVDVATRATIVDVITGSSPAIPRGNVAQIEIALFNNGAIVDSFAGIESLTLEIRSKAAPAAPAYLTKTVAVAAFTACTLEAWNAGTGYHAIINLADTETDLPSDSTEIAYWLAVGATLSSGPVTLGTGVLLIQEDGIGGSGGAGAYPTLAEADARYLRRLMPNASFRADPNGQHIQLFDPDIAQWRSLIIAGGALALGPGEA